MIELPEMRTLPARDGTLYTYARVFAGSAYRPDTLRTFATAYANAAVLADRKSRGPAQGVSIDWIPVTEKLPDDDLCVLIALADGEVFAGFMDAGRWRYVVSADLVKQTVTHWAAMPAGPVLGEKHA